MDPKHKKKLRGIRIPLSNDLTVCELWDPLVQALLFTPKELEELERSKSPISRLLDAIETKGPDALQRFKKAVEHVKPHLLDLFNENTEVKGNTELQLEGTMDYTDCELKLEGTVEYTDCELKEKPDEEGGSLLEKHLEHADEKRAELQLKLDESNAKLEEERADKQKLQLKVRNLNNNARDLSAQNYYLNRYVKFITDAHTHLTVQQENLKFGHKYLFDQNTILINEKSIVLNENEMVTIENTELKNENAKLRKDMDKVKRFAENMEENDPKIKRKKFNL